MLLGILQKYEINFVSLHRVSSRVKTDLSIFLFLLFLTAEEKQGFFFFSLPVPCSFPSCLFLDRCQQNPNHSLRSWFRMRMGDKKLNNSGAFSQQKGRKKKNPLVFSFWKISTLLLTSNLNPLSRTWPFYESVPTKDQIILFFKKSICCRNIPSSTSTQTPDQDASHGEQNRRPGRYLPSRRNKRKLLIGLRSISDNPCFEHGTGTL